MHSKMSLFLLLVIISLFNELLAENVEITQVILDTKEYKWEGLNSKSSSINVTAENYTISVSIETCNIGNPASRPNNEYLILKNGDENTLSSDNGRIFAYIKKPKKIYFYSSSVILQLITPQLLTKKCSVTFKKGDEEDPTLPPVTTTEAMTTFDPEISKYSTVYLYGHSIDEFNKQKIFINDLKNSIAEMAKEYTKTEGFCLIKEVESKDIDIYTLEQCPTRWPDFDNCVRLVYALPVKIDSSCSIWKGYQITQSHLDLMWSRLASKYLKDTFSVYHQPEIDSLISWWVVSIVLVILLFTTAIIIINLLWRRRQMFEREHILRDDFSPDNRRISEMSLPYFQPIPPMFGKTETEDMKGADNKGFLYDALNVEENGTTI